MIIRNLSSFLDRICILKWKLYFQINCKFIHFNIIKITNKSSWEGDGQKYKCAPLLSFIVRNHKCSLKLNMAKKLHQSHNIFHNFFLNSRGVFKGPVCHICSSCQQVLHFRFFSSDYLTEFLIYSRKNMQGCVRMSKK